MFGKSQKSDGVTERLVSVVELLIGRMLGAKAGHGCRGGGGENKGGR